MTKIDFVNYPVYENDVTPFIKRFLAFKTIYSAMIYTIDNEDVITMLEDNLKIFFERFEKFINTTPKMENENSLKQ